MNETIERTSAFPLPTIRRLPAYLRTIRELAAAGEDMVSCTVLAEALGIDLPLARKDIAMLGVRGQCRWGYPAKGLEAAITEVLGWNNTADAALVGVGSLGHALIGYGGFAEKHLSIAVAFDSDPSLHGTRVHGVTVRPVADIPRLVKRLRIRLGILTVPAAAAQVCADALVTAGVDGIWNFTATKLSVPDAVIVQNIDLSESLAVLSHAIAKRQRTL